MPRVDAKQVKTNTAAFDGALSSSDTDVQKALDTLDDATVIKTIVIALEGLGSAGNDKEKFKIQVPEAGWTLVEVAGKLRVTGTTFTIQLREITNAGVDNGDVLTTPLAFGSADNAQTTGFVAGRFTPAKNVHYALDIDASTGGARGLALQLRFTGPLG